MLGVRYGVHPDKTRVVLEFAATVPYRILMLADPARLTIDLPRITWPAQTLPRTGDGVVQRFHYGWQDAETARITLHLATPARIVNQFMMGSEPGHGPRLVIDLAATDTHGFRQNLGRVYGTLDSSYPPPAPVSPASVSPAPISPTPVSPPPKSAPEPPTATPATAKPDRPAVSRAGQPMPAGVESLPLPQRPQTEGTQTDGPQTKGPQTKGPQTEERQAIPSTGLARLPATRPATPAPATRRLVVIDAGHGGIDPGALGYNGLREKDITLEMARALKREIENSGRYRVVMTRQRDEFLPLRERVAVAREHKADLFVSLHADSIGSSNFRGFSVYTLSDTASDREAEMLAAKENRADALGGVDLSRESDVVASILIDLAQRDTMNHSRRFAKSLVNSLRTVGPLVPKPHRSAGFAVLTAADVPSALIELGYITNANDALRLSEPEERVKIARAIARAVDQYFVWLVTALASG
jgi:N-acetylmuramoyl-L-alanine amidase